MYEGMLGLSQHLTSPMAFPSVVYVNQLSVHKFIRSHAFCNFINELTTTLFKETKYLSEKKKQTRIITEETVLFAWHTTAAVVIT